MAFLVVLLAGTLGGARVGVAHGLLLLPVLMLGFMQLNGGVVDVPALLTGGVASLGIGVILGGVTGRLRDLHVLVSRQRRQLEYQATHDHLTGLLNRAAITRALEDALEERRGGVQVAVAFLDLDDFKRVNDDHGHAVGDEVLRELGRRMRARGGPERTWGRLSGDEFILVARLSGGAEPGLLRREVEELLQAPIQAGAVRVWAGASVGLTLAEEGDGAPALIGRADTLMYSHKRAGQRGRDVRRSG